MFDIVSSLFSHYTSLSHFSPKTTRGMLYSRRYELPDATTIVPVTKYKLLKDRILKDPVLRKIPMFEIHEGASQADLYRVHTKEYIYDFMEFIPSNEIISAEIPLTFEVQEFFLHATAGSILGLNMARESKGIFVNLSGGFHHAFTDHAEGFCYINDVCVAIEKEIARKPGKALVLDLDIHQGNGVVNFYKDRSDVLVANLHQSDNYPLKEAGGINVELESGANGADYLQALETLLTQVEHQWNAAENSFGIYLAGADPYQEDKLGGFMLTIEDLANRDRIVKDFFQRLNLPLLCVLAGGYAEKPEDIVSIYMNLLHEMMSE
ncbi:MAG: histone deacetylase [Leptospiraceae bacterium]|nr:histone deacetylase [Leptospiraceae bacterium]